MQTSTCSDAQQPSKMPHWIDSHCHLNHSAFADDADLFANLQVAGCGAVVVPGTKLSDVDAIVNLQKHYGPWVHFALGLHPYFMDEHTEQDLDQLALQVKRYSPLAIGEIGLDFVLPSETHALQMQYFEKQVALAQQQNLPLILHCRKAHDQLTSYLKRVGFSNGGIVHGFSGSLQQAKVYSALGFVVGLGGALTYERAKAMHKLVAALQDDAYVLETDSPYMPPAFARDQANTPLNIPQIAQQIAVLRQQPLTQVYAQSTANFKRVFQLS